MPATKTDSAKSNASNSGKTPSSASSQDGNWDALQDKFDEVVQVTLSSGVQKPS
jgi:hypothetical protein